MGYDQTERSGSSGAIVVVILAVLLVVFLGLVAVGGVAFFWLSDVRMETQQAIVAEERAVAEAYRADAEVMAQTQDESGIEAAPDPRPSFRVAVDADGNVSVDGQQIGLDELKVRLASRKEETHNAFTVHIIADSKCPAGKLVPVLGVCEEVGDIDFRVATTGGPESASGEDDAGK